MATGTILPPIPERMPPQVPPLRNGDRLTRDEFERRYEAMPNLKKAELIEGVVYVPSPIRFSHHCNPHFNLIGWLAPYVTATPGVAGGDNGTLRLDLDNEPQPDAFVIITPECGGRVHIDTQDYIVGGPEFVAEVAASSVSYDCHVKLNAYRRNGVQEYVVWRVEDRAIDWFEVRGGRYEPLPVSDGIYRSNALPGLWLAPEALIGADLPEVARVLNEGLQSAAHREFVEKLAKTQSKS